MRAVTLINEQDERSLGRDGDEVRMRNGVPLTTRHSNLVRNEWCRSIEWPNGLNHHGSRLASCRLRARDRISEFGSIHEATNWEGELRRALIFRRGFHGSAEPHPPHHGCGSAALAAYDSRRALAIGRRAARMAGKRPPRSPTTAAMTIARKSSVGVTAKAKAIWLQVWKFMVAAPQPSNHR